MTLKNLKKLFFPIILFYLIGCDISGATPRLLGEEGPKPSDEEMKIFFFENMPDILSVRDFCMNNLGVKWLGIESGDVEVAGSVKATPDVELLHEVRESLKFLGAEVLICTRDWSLPSIPLVSVVLPLYSSGLSVSGSRKGYRYIVNLNASVKAKIQSGELIVLGEKGWYIYSSES